MRSDSTNINVAQVDVAKELTSLGVQYRDFVITNTSIVGEEIYHNIDSKVGIENNVAKEETPYDIHKMSDKDESKDYPFHYVLRVDADQTRVGNFTPAAKRAFPDDVEALERDHEFMQALMDLAESYEQYNITQEQGLYAIKAIAEDLLLQYEFEEL